VVNGTIFYILSKEKIMQTMPRNTQLDRMPLAAAGIIFRFVVLEE